MTRRETLAKLNKVEQMLADWLVDNTDEVFEEQPEIDEARGLLIEAIEELEGRA